MSDPNAKEHYDLVPDEPDDASRRLHADRVERAVEAQSRAKVVIPPSEDTVDLDPKEVESADAADESLTTPISPASSAQAWCIAALGVLAVILLAWFAGAQGLLVPSGAETPDALELSILERLAGAVRTVTFAVLATAGFAFGIFCLAFTQQRPLGDVLSLLAKCAFIAAVGMLAWLIPCDIRILKLALNNLGPLATGALLYAVLFRLPPKDALLAVAYAVLGMTLLVLFSASVVWSARL